MGVHNTVLCLENYRVKTHIWVNIENLVTLALIFLLNYYLIKVTYIKLRTFAEANNNIGN